MFDQRRKFRSQTSDIWTDAATVEGKVRKERARRKNIKMREKADKSRNTVFCQCFVAPEDGK
jgi:hypothetical protein